MSTTYNEEKILSMAHYILENKSTIRATAQTYKTPKSTVHHDLSNKLKFINYPLFKEVKKHLENNFSTKHIHGGEATKKKYEKLKLIVDKNEELEIYH